MRRIIELGTPYIVRESRGQIGSVTLVAGEEADAQWKENLAGQLRPTPVQFSVEPSFSYRSEQSKGARRVRADLHNALERVFGSDVGDDCIVWAHNLGIGRNLLLSAALADACTARRIRLLAHHHDWWFDNRWRHWPEMKKSGARSVWNVAGIVFPTNPEVHHIAINQSDTRVLKRYAPEAITWLPNLAERNQKADATQVRRAQKWVGDRLGDKKTPIWLIPARLLRRKNVAEAILLARWLRPEGWLLTTGGVSSAEEFTYAETLERAIRKHGWQVKLGVLQSADANGPGVGELLALSEVVLMTSIQEGFGLPYIEAAAAGRPLIAREIPNISPDLATMGFRFPQLYAEIMVPPALFDWQAEQKQQEKLFGAWKRQLPREYRGWAGTPVVLQGSSSSAVPLSRLTFSAQLEVLAQPTELSWKLCVPLNRFLPLWKERAQKGKMGLTDWPEKADRWISGPAYARRFWGSLRGRAKAQTKLALAEEIQTAFIREKLASDNLFPLLWASES